MPSKDHAVLQQQQQQDITSTNKTSSTSVTRPKMDAKARCSAAEHENLREDFKAMEIVVEDGDGTLDELSFKVVSYGSLEAANEGHADIRPHTGRPQLDRTARDRCGQCRGHSPPLPDRARHPDSYSDQGPRI